MLIARGKKHLRAGRFTNIITKHHQSTETIAILRIIKQSRDTKHLPRTLKPKFTSRQGEHLTKHWHYAFTRTSVASIIPRHETEVKEKKAVDPPRPGTTPSVQPHTHAWPNRPHPVKTSQFLEIFRAMPEPYSPSPLPVQPNAPIPPPRLPRYRKSKKPTLRRQFLQPTETAPAAACTQTSTTPLTV